MTKSNSFSLFGLEPCFSIDEKELERKYFDLQRQYHPDRFALRPAAERIAALTKSTEITNAYQVLKNPLRRAEYLLSLHDINVGSEKDNVKPSHELLMEVMEIRERLEEVNTAQQIAELQDFVTKENEKSLRVLQKDFADSDFNKAAEEAIRLRYLTKILEEIRRKRKSGVAA